MLARVHWSYAMRIGGPDYDGGHYRTWRASCVSEPGSPVRGRRPSALEMFGDVAKADVIMSFMPGTNTTMESFYTSTADEGLTCLTRRMVEYPPDGVELAGFVLKQGFFPNLAPPEVAVFGPQVNLWALPLGSR